MTKKWIAINLLLLATAALLGWQLRKSIDQFKAENNLAKIQPAADLKQKMLREKPFLKTIPTKTYNPAEFSAISEKNLFSESRSKEERIENIAAPEPSPLAQKPILTGVIISDTERKASIIDPIGPADQRNRRGLIRRVGDVYQGYTITEIASDRIVLESGARREVIPLREGSKRGQGGKTPILSTRIVPIGGGGATGGTPVTVAASGSTPVAARTAVAPIGTPIPTVTTQPGGTIMTAVPGRPASPAQPAPTQPAQPAQQGETPTRVIRTPFGDTAQPAQPAPGEAPTRVIRTPFGDIARPAR